MPCEAPLGYVCEIRAEQQYPVPEPDWEPCSDEGMAAKVRQYFYLDITC